MMSRAARCAVLAAAGWLASWPAVAEPEASQPSLWQWTVELAGEAYETVRAGAIDPALGAAGAALSSSTVEEGCRNLRDMAASAAATVDQAASDAFNSRTAAQIEDFAGDAYAAIADGVRRYLAAPLGALIKSPVDRSGDRRAPEDQAGAISAAAAATPMPHAASPSASGGTSMPRMTRPATATAADDPFESFNRWVFALNRALRSSLLTPVASFYRNRTPSAVQQGVQNFFGNLREPITVVSSLLEGEFADAGNATARFGINTTVGIVGVYDPATSYGFPRQMHNLEEVLCTYRIPSGPYLVLPVYGPATMRDAVGRIATVVAYFEAMGFNIYLPYRIGDAVARAAVAKDAAAPADNAAADPYLAQKLSYLQGRDGGCSRLSDLDPNKLSP